MQEQASQKQASQNTWLSRSVLLCACVLVLAAASWIFSQTRSAAQVSDVTADYFDAVTYRTNGSTEQLIATLEKRLNSSEANWRTYSTLGLAFLQRARETGDPTFYARADKVLKQALELEPEDYTATSAMGALALARHQFGEALEWGTRARQLNPHKSYAYGVIVDAQVELGRYDQAVDTLQQMADLRPDLNSYTRISYARELHGDREGALEMMQRAVDSSGTHAETRAWTRTQLANLYFERGDLAQAETEYQRALETMPGYIYALAGLGRVRASKGNVQEGITLLQQATATIPLPEFVILLGDLYHVSGDERSARNQYDTVSAIQQLYRANGVDLDLEMALFNADHSIDPRGTVEQARQVFARRPSIQAADVLAWALYQVGAYQEAQSYSQRALRLGTKDALKLYHAGMIAYRLGDTNQARAYLAQALAANPHFSFLYAPQAQQQLQALTR